MKKYYHIALLCFIAFQSSLTSYSQTQDPNYQDGKIYLKLSDDFPLKLVMSRDSEAKSNLLEQYNFVSSVADQFGITNMYRPFSRAKGAGGDALQRTFLIEFSDFANIESLIRQLYTSNMVDYVEKVPLYKNTVVPNDPMHGSLWGLAQIQAEQAWNISTGNANVVVAVADNAIQITHTDLVNMIWTNPGETPGDGIDNDGNGYIDDVHGWDVGDDDNNPNPISNSWNHGTHCAGTIGAESNNGTGVSSIGYGISIMPVKVTTNSASSTSVTNGYDGIYYAALSGADVISCSWGGYGYSTTGQNLVNWAWGQGSIIVAAAGNDNNNMDSGGNAHYPSNYNNVICVASSTTGDVKSSFSNYGSAVDVTAPGSNIRSTVPTNNYSYMSGTSMATPLVSGLLGLMISAQPGLPQQDYVDCLINSCDNINGANSGYIGDLGSGRVNALTSLNCVTAFSNNPPIADFQANLTTITAGGTVQFTDMSIYNPASWSWNFDNQGIGGVTPATANTQGPHNIVFTTPGVYEVTLTVTNANGNNTETKTAYITVNSAAGCSQLNLDDPTFATLASIHVGWTPTLYTTSGNGHLAGINEYGDKAKVEYFPQGMVGAANNVVGTYIWFGTSYSGNANKTVDINVYDVVAGEPGAILGTRTVTMGEIGNGGIQYYSFNPPITLSGTNGFFVGVDMSNLNYAAGDSMGIVTNTNGNVSGTAGWELWSDDTWSPYVGSWTSITALSNYIFPDLTSAPPTINLTASTTTICAGETVDFDATGSTFEDTLVWTFVGTNPINSTNVTASPVYNSAGTYKAYLEVVGGGCSNYLVDSVSITVNPSPTIIINASDPEICVGDGPVTITASGATSYVWSPGGQTSAVISVNPATTTTYSVVGTSGGCEGTGTIQIMVGALPVLSSSITNVYCNGGSTGAIDLTVSNLSNCTYNWGAQGTNEDLTGLFAGSYNVIVTSDMSCTASASYSVTQNGVINVVPTPTNASCAGSDGTISLAITGGVGPYTTNYGADNPNALAPGSHSYVVTDAVGCTFSGSYSISTTGGPTLVVSSTNVLCNGGNNGTASVSISGGTAPYTEDWAGATIGSLTAGTYSVTVTDAGSCVSSEVVIITQPAALVANSTISHVTCNGLTDGAVTLNISGGTPAYSQNWGAANPNMLGAGSYPVTITDANSCILNTNVTVNEPAIISATETLTNVDCNGGSDGSAFLNISGGTAPFTENWQGESNTALGAGTFTVIITDANNCLLNYDVTITEPAAIVINSTTTDVTCNGFTNGTASLSISGGTPAYTQNWGGANPASLAAGTHNVSVTDANGCSTSSSVTINEPTALSVSGSITDEVSGNDGAVNISVSGGSPVYTFNWGLNGTSEDLSGLAGGTYSVTITDANGCTISDSYIVNSTLGVSEEGETIIVFNVYPNPVKNVLNIQLLGEYSYTILNDLGQKLNNGLGQTESIVDMSLFTPGVYFVKVLQGNKLYTTKVVKN